MKLKPFAIMLFVLALWHGLLGTGTAEAEEVPFYSYSVDAQNRTVSMNPAYLPVRAIGNDLPRTMDGKADTLKYPEDVFISKDDHLYVADRGNDRVVEFDASGAFVRFIGHEPGKGKLKGPEGIFVHTDGSIYVADTGNSRIAKYDAQGTFLREYMAPASDYLPKSYQWVPSKLVVDNRDILYIVSKGGYQGMLQMSQSNEFLGFYGKNAVHLSIIDKMQQMFYSKEQKEKLSDVFPGSITNVNIDEAGFIYTTTMSVTKEQIKRLNFPGQNILSEKEFKIPFSNTSTKEYAFKDVAVNASGMITAFDAKSNLILQYDANGKLLFGYGGEPSNAPQLGVLKSPSSLALNSRGDIVVSDSSTNIVHLLQPTQFTQLVLEATGLYAEGKYAESEQPWRKVLDMNEFYDRAHLGLAKVYYKKRMWREAMAEFKLGLDNKGYSDAYWQLRMLWLQRHFSTIMTLAVCTAIAYGAWNRRRVKNGVAGGRMRFGHEFAWQIRQCFRLLKHPILVFEELRDSKRGTWTFALLLLAAALVCRLAEDILTGFVFDPRPVELINPIRSAGSLFVPVVSWAIGNYMISTLFRGEGDFKTVFIATIYSLAPYVLLSIPIAVISNVLTNVESVIYVFYHSFMLIWVVFLLYLKVQVVHNYEVRETVGNISLSIFAISVMWFSIFVHTSLSFELKDFVISITEELMFRG